jgi:hypothetical protein
MRRASNDSFRSNDCRLSLSLWWFVSQSNAQQRYVVNCVAIRFSNPYDMPRCRRRLRRPIDRIAIATDEDDRSSSENENDTTTIVQSRSMRQYKYAIYVDVQSRARPDGLCDDTRNRKLRTMRRCCRCFKNSGLDLQQTQQKIRIERTSFSYSTAAG